MELRKAGIYAQLRCGSMIVIAFAAAIACKTSTGQSQSQTESIFWASTANYDCKLLDANAKETNQLGYATFSDKTLFKSAKMKFTAASGKTYEKDLQSAVLITGAVMISGLDLIDRSFFHWWESTEQPIGGENNLYVDEVLQPDYKGPLAGDGKRIGFVQWQHTEPSDEVSFGNNRKEENYKCVAK